MVNSEITFGFPRMMKEQGEVRVFLPEFIQHLASMGGRVYIEEGYGSRSGLNFDDYRRGSEAVRYCGHEQAFLQDFVIVLRSPTLEEFQLLKPGSTLISMLHFPTRPRRVELLSRLGVNAISMDSIVDDNNLRLVENMKAVAWNGLEVAFNVLEREWPGLHHPEGRPIHVLVLGTGMVGKHAVEAATKLGNVERNNQHMQAGGLGAVALSVGRNVTGNLGALEGLFRQADILVDATQRRDPSKPVVRNEWIEWLATHAVITDLAVDPYTLETNPPVVRGVEGIPMGDLNQYIFEPEDPSWDQTVPAAIPSLQRRRVATCYSWPGLHAEACMRHYAQQLTPLIDVLFERGYDQLNPQGGYFERALYRGGLRAWLRSGHYERRPR